MTNINDKVEYFELDTDQGKFHSKDHTGKNLVIFFCLKPHQQVKAELNLVAEEGFEPPTFGL